MKKPCHVARELKASFMRWQIDSAGSTVSTDGSESTQPDSGESATAIAATMAITMTTEPKETKAMVQPVACSSHKNGTADRNWPSWRKAAVTAVNIGVRCSGNQNGNSRITDRKA